MTKGDQDFTARTEAIRKELDKQMESVLALETRLETEESDHQATREELVATRQTVSEREAALALAREKEQEGIQTIESMQVSRFDVFLCNGLCAVLVLG